MALTNDGGAYQVAYGAALTVHIATALAGFALLGLSGLYAAWGRSIATPKDLHDLRQFFGTPNRIGRSLWAVPFAGGIALWLSHGVGALAQAWAIAAIICWAAATALAVSVVWPAEQRIRLVVVRLSDTPFEEVTTSDREDLAALCRPIIRAAGACDVIFVVALALMILKPGG